MNENRLKYAILIVFLSFSCVFSQDFHQREAKSVEEIIYKNDPNRAKTLFNKGNYLVLENLRNNSRKRFYVGDVFRCKTKDDFVFENDIYSITDSSFVVASLNEVSNRYEYVEIKLNEIKRIYKRPKRNIHINLATFSPLGYLIIEWIYYKVPPQKNTKLPIAIGLTIIQPFFGVISNQFRSRKLTENYRVRVFKTF